MISGKQKNPADLKPAGFLLTIFSVCAIINVSYSRQRAKVLRDAVQRELPKGGKRL